MAYVDSPFDSATPRQPRGFSYPSQSGNTGVSGFGGGNPAPSLGQDPATSSAPAAPPAAPKYAPIQGFDFGKLSGTTPYDSKQKYSDAVRAFSQGLGSGVHYGRNDLGGMMDYLHSHGFANAHGVGDDKIDFGDGEGAIDTIMSNGGIWFQNGADRFAPPPQQSAQQMAYGPDPMASLLGFAPTLFGPSPMPQQAPQPPQMPAVFSDPSFWQQMMGAMQPQAPASMPNFSGAQAGTGGAPAPGMNPQMTQLLSQLFAGLTGGR